MVLLALAACGSHIQTSSGADYLARYDAPSKSAQKSGTDGLSNLDAEIRDIANIEPNLQFPARIGLARIEYGRLVGLPGDDGQVFSELVADLGPEFGSFVPVSPLIAAMVDDTPAPQKRGVYQQQNGTQEVIADIRRGAARQHLDYVLIYEVGSARAEKANGLALSDLTIIGMFVLPSRDIEIEATASAILVDVRNGYPYATLTGFAEKDGMARPVSAVSKTRSLSEEAELRAVEHLAEEAEAALRGLAEAAE
ncbi:MAG: hypothetical protein RLN72_14965 [Henriciella sp.]